MEVGRLARGRAAARQAAPRGGLPERTAPRAALGPTFAVRAAFIWPALLVILFVSIFPLFASLYISLSRLELARGGVSFHFLRLADFRELLLCGEQHHLVGGGRP